LSRGGWIGLRANDVKAACLSIHADAEDDYAKLPSRVGLDVQRIRRITANEKVPANFNCDVCVGRPLAQRRPVDNRFPDWLDNPG